MSIASSDIFATDRQLVTGKSDLAPQPTCLAETGLTDTMVIELIVKHLYEGGVLSMSDLRDRIRLPATILEEQLTFLRREARIEIRSSTESTHRFGLTDKGRVVALDALMRSGYVGPAPVPIEQYCEIARAQTVHADVTDRVGMNAAFDKVVLPPELLDQLGSAMNSGRAIFIYGPAGTGKTYITQQLSRLLGDSILIPYAIAVGEMIIELYDAVLHKPAAPVEDVSSLALNRGHDQRFAHCKRPVAIVGGELTIDMLEVNYDPSHKIYRAPLQMRANNGILIIDDMGRQRVAPEDLLNRWIVPLEEARDYLHVGSGMHFSVPFDVILIFSTNLNPLDLADEAFLRRIGHKIYFGYLTPEDYTRIWRQNCDEFQIPYDPEIARFTIEELHRANNTPLLPCHPRDLLRMALDHAGYVGEPGEVTKERLRWAWKNYFVSLDTSVTDKPCAKA
ncbi:MAG: AAA family ATPase [Gammaproteobacteria bacterium]|nr:AAA family ATPase [Gammaproteobacteria bacterium]